VPEYLEILGAAAGLPPLPDFSVNLYVAPSAKDVTQELARHIRQGFEVRFGNARPALLPRRGLHPAAAMHARMASR
jgi:hypothetical protein